MRRTLTVLAAATSLALGTPVATAAAAPAEPSVKSVHFYCPRAPVNDHPGLHLGWQKSPSNERRNVGGTCPGPGVV